ncbi:MAG: hypothetical protein UT63_C0019G0024 [Candidatus Gottesmanbacteria bacterium GW2011_GWC2_39_8]|uniref:Uncharacterized protein n=1 Tax=Candidatus Gottesmanbacteria bacterium GW2011_GWC2_39_8 TaxID=1618450 RepID=A0A0G0T648_9BACT|nr:MAG: hypothetical protein UT63_C0019G0024 [Candidatus Gottesmanbacteria bacterium GW2011_GWC2_39_8]
MNTSYDANIKEGMARTRAAKFVMGLVFAVVLLLLTVPTIIYAKKTDIDWNKTVISPIKKAAESIRKNLEESVKSIPKPTIINTSKSSSDSQVKVEIETTVIPTPTIAKRKYTLPYSPTPTAVVNNNADVWKQEDEWWQKAQVENRKRSEESRKQLLDFQKQSQERMQQFREQGQQGMQDFQNQMEEAQKEFKEKYGF